MDVSKCFKRELHLVNRLIFSAYPCSTLIRYVLDVFPLGGGHVAQIGEDHKPGEKGGEGVHSRGHQTVSKKDRTAV